MRNIFQLCSCLPLCHMGTAICSLSCCRQNPVTISMGLLHCAALSDGFSPSFFSTVIFLFYTGFFLSNHSCLSFNSCSCTDHSPISFCVWNLYWTQNYKTVIYLDVKVSINPTSSPRNASIFLFVRYFTSQSIVPAASIRDRGWSLHSCMLSFLLVGHTCSFCPPSSPPSCITASISSFPQRVSTALPHQSL